MKRLLVGFAIGLVLDAFVNGQAVPIENRQETGLSADGSVRLQLASGNYIVRAGRSDRVLVYWQAEDTKYERDMRKIRVRTSISGRVASIWTEGPTKRARMTIEIPTISH